MKRLLPVSAVLLLFFSLNSAQAEFLDDNDIDGSDLAAFASEFNNCTSGCNGDFVGAPDVDDVDLSVFSVYFGKTGGNGNNGARGSTFSFNTDGTSVETQLNAAAYQSDSTEMAAGSSEWSQCPDGLISYWKFDETTTGLYVDDSGTNNDDGQCPAPPVVCPAPEAGKLGGGQYFNGESTGIDASGNLFNWDGNDSFSVECWFKTPESSTASGNEVLVGRDDREIGLHWWVGLLDGGYGAFYLGDTSGQALFLQGTTDLTDGTWHHLVAIRDADSGENRLYIDGDLEDIGVTVYDTGFHSNTANLNIGWLNLFPYYHFEGTLDEVALYARTLSLAEIQQHKIDGRQGLSRGYCGCGREVKIMPLGNSLTLGISIYMSDNDYLVGYRQKLYLDLVDRGYVINFVGGIKSGQLADPPFDFDHEGHAGWTDDQILHGNPGTPEKGKLEDWLNTYQPNVVLLHIGSNGLDTSTVAIEGILDKIDDYSEEVVVLLARIINRMCCTNDSPCAACGVTTTFNDEVQKMAEIRIANGDKIIIVDMEDGAGIDYYEQPEGDMDDLLHPNMTGYNKMADKWLEELETFLPVCGPAPPSIVSSPVIEGIVGLPYAYDVNSTGSPVSTYSLTSAPDGMSINNITGLIEWSPHQVGTFDVIVVASNGELPDATQAFTITVAECPHDIVSYWKFNDEASPYVDYYSTNNGTCKDCPVNATGIVGSALQFDGIDDEIHVAGTDAFNWHASDDFSIAYWMKSSSTCSGNEVVVGRDDSTTNLHWWIGCWDQGDEATFVLIDKNGDGGGNYAWPSSGIDVTDGTWHHIAAVKDSTHIRLYVDGVERDSVEKSYTAGFDGIAALNIGFLNLSGRYRYEGALDEMAIYDRALTPLEIYQHYADGWFDHLGYCDLSPFGPEIVSHPATNAFVGHAFAYDVDAVGAPAPTYELTSSPAGMEIDRNSGLIQWFPDTAGTFDVTVVASNGGGNDDMQTFVVSVSESICPRAMISYWNMNEDRSPYGDFYGDNDAICTDCPGHATGIVGYSTEFDGADDEIHVTGSDFFDWGMDDSFSIEYWMKSISNCSGNEVVVGRDDGTTNLHWWVGCWDQGDEAVFVLIDKGGDPGGDSYLLLGGMDVTDGLWHHIAAVKDSTHIRLYVDGVERNSEAKSYSGGFDGISDIDIGFLNASGHYRYEGALDEVAVYDRALSAIEVELHYGNGLAGHGYCAILDYDGDGVSDNEDNCPITYNSDQIDSDGDWVGNACDNCPEMTNVEQVDFDGDGAGDACDLCPEDPEKRDPGQCGCGVEDTDTDNDGIADCQDSCPDDQVNDMDGDGVCGDVDNCPATENPGQEDLDFDGLGDVCDEDRDGDGYVSVSLGGNDCDDHNASIHPGAAEIPYDGIDQDCDGSDFAPDDDNHAPTAKAPEDETLFIVQIDTTIIEGIATDEDANDELQYRWLEGGTVLLDWTAVGGNGVCPLDLSTILLATGYHTLTLEVTDGIVALPSSDVMTLLIEPNVAGMVTEKAKVCWHHGDLHVAGNFNFPAGISMNTLSPVVRLGVMLAGVGVTDQSVNFVITGKNNDKWEYKDKDNANGNIKEVKVDWKGAKFDYHGDDGFHIHTHFISGTETTLCIHTGNVSGPFVVTIAGISIVYDANRNITVPEGITFEPENDDYSHVHFALPFEFFPDMTIAVSGSLEIAIDAAEHYDMAEAKFKLVSAFNPELFPERAATTPDTLDYVMTFGDGINMTSVSDRIDQGAMTNKDDNHWKYK